MTKELTAIIALALTVLITAVSGSIRIGALIERVEHQSMQIDAQSLQIRDLRSEIRAINDHLIAYVARHERDRR